MLQVADAIRQHTTVQEEHLCVYTSETKKRPNALVCFMVTTYGMFSSAGSARSQHTREIRQFVLNNKWALVVLDEAHHVAAETYRRFIETLALNSKRILGFTGTLVRTVPAPASEASAVVVSEDGWQAAQAEARAEHMASFFSFIGPVLHSRTCRELEDEGLIARVRVLEVHTKLTETFDAALRATSNAVSKKYIESLHPQKLNALWILVRTHVKLGEVGMVFVNHLLHAKIVKRLLGDKWEILSGSNAHGDDGSHSAQDNAKIIARFNRGQLHGIISTPVGESALDINNPDFCYVVGLDQHGGPASASQQQGRLSRTPRLEARPSESDADPRKRRREAQKKGWYYEILTLGTEEMTAAASRRAQFRYEGYGHVEVSYATMRATHPDDVPLPFETELEQTRLLVDALTYSDKGAAAKKGAAAASAVRQSHQKKMKEAKKKSKEAKSSVFREKNKEKHILLKKNTSAVKAEAKAIRKDTIDGAELTPTARAVLTQLRLKPSLLKTVGVDLGAAAATASAEGSRNAATARTSPSSSPGARARPRRPRPPRIGATWCRRQRRGRMTPGVAAPERRPRPRRACAFHDSAHHPPPFLLLLLSVASGGSAHACITSSLVRS